LRNQANDFFATHNVGKQLKTFRELISHEYCYNLRTKEPEQFSRYATYQMQGQNSYMLKPEKLY